MIDRGRHSRTSAFLFHASSAFPTSDDVLPLTFSCDDEAWEDMNRVLSIWRGNGEMGKWGKTWRSDILRSDSLTDGGIPQILPLTRLLSSVTLCASNGMLICSSIGCSAVAARFTIGTARLQAQFIRQRINSWSMGCSDASRERWRRCQWLQNSGVRPEYRWGHMQGATLLELENRTLARATAFLQHLGFGAIVEGGDAADGQPISCQAEELPLRDAFRYKVQEARPQSLSAITHGVRLGARAVSVLACAYRAWSANKARVDITLSTNLNSPCSFA